MGIVLAILIFGFIVFFHELGHFALARKNGIDVDEFAIGMGPAIFSREYKGTHYAVRLLPIGGFCAMGEDAEATDNPGNFNNKSVWARIAVIASGPVFNFILAFVAAVVLTAMTGYDKPVIVDVDEGYPAAEAGMQPGDSIVKIDGKRIHFFREISYYNQLHQGETVEVTYVRDGEEKTVVLTPAKDEESGYYRFGITGGELTEPTLLTSVQYGAYEVKFWINVTVESLGMLLSGELSVKEISGPVGIVNVVDETYQESRSYGIYVVVAQLLQLVILLSANLGVFNLLPFPALDGGRLVFLLIEAVRGKRIPPEKEGYVHMVGLALLMCLMAVVLFHDVKRVFF